MDIYRLLATIGKKFFYENYEDIENERYDVIYEKYKGVYTEKSIKSRYGHGRMIFNHNLQDEAMEIVLNSNAKIDL